MDKNRKEKMNMRLAQKIFNERKRLGLSQEQFAEQMEVSRQAVSKWESGQSMPDLDKLVLMSQIFGVTTDYLLKEEEVDSFKEPAKEAEYIGDNCLFKDTSSEQAETVRKLKEEEIKEYHTVCLKTSGRISLGVFLCIFGGVLVNAVEMYLFPKGIDTGLSAVPMLICITAAVGLFVFSGMQTGKFVFLKTQPFLLPEEEKSRLEEEYDEFYKTFVSRVITGVVLCVCGVIVYILCCAVGDIHVEEIKGRIMWDYIAVMGLLLSIAIAAFVLVSAGMRKEYYDVLLQKDGFSELRKKARNEKRDVIVIVAGIYWCIITAVFLAYSFTTGNWGKSWIIWPVAGCMFGAISIALLFIKVNKINK